VVPVADAPVSAGHLHHDSWPLATGIHAPIAIKPGHDPAVGVQTARGGGSKCLDRLAHRPHRWRGTQLCVSGPLDHAGGCVGVVVVRGDPLLGWQAQAGGLPILHVLPINGCRRGSLTRQGLFGRVSGALPSALPGRGSRAQNEGGHCIFMYLK
jgi:hypothetical protein